MPAVTEKLSKKFSLGYDTNDHVDVKSKSVQLRTDLVNLSASRILTWSWTNLCEFCFVLLINYEVSSLFSVATFQ